MIRKKCLGCGCLITRAFALENNNVIECCYTMPSRFIPNCPCADCLLKSICTSPCLDFINKLLKYKYRITSFDDALELHKLHILGITFISIGVKT
jgi:hypothetical protein